MLSTVSNSAFPVRPTYRPGSASSPAMEKLVPGDYPQTEQDLASFPQPVLDMLSRYGTRVAVLGEGQTMLDSPALRTLTAEEVALEQQRASTLVTQKVEDAFRQGVNSYEQLEAAANAITRDLREVHIDNHLGIALNPFPLDQLAEARNIPAESLDDWKLSFQSLNEGLVTASESGETQATYGVLVLPHTYHNGAAIPESRLRNASDVTADYVKGSLGLNRAEERMVLLHEEFLPLPNPELGNYRLSIHEVGHALDYALENLGPSSGFGPAHRQTMDALFEADQKRLADGQSADSVFTSDRADDNVREYFAEAVEAYLTPASGNGHDTFRAGNSREGLASRNPQLFGYVDRVMRTEFPQSAMPEMPARQLLPPDIPDPDTEVVRIS